MMSEDFRVAGVSWDKIADITEKIREYFRISDFKTVPVIELLEKIMDQRLDMVRLEIRDEAEMRSAEGYTCPEGSVIILREDVYRDAYAGDGRARFTVAHELGHFFLHSGTPLARVTDPNSTRPYERAEPQANQFAAEFLMPQKFLSSSDKPEQLVARHGVSLKAATNRLAYMRSRSKFIK